MILDDSGRNNFSECEGLETAVSHQIGQEFSQVPTMAEEKLLR